MGGLLTCVKVCVTDSRVLDIDENLIWSGLWNGYFLIFGSCVLYGQPHSTPSVPGFLPVIDFEVTLTPARLVDDLCPLFFGDVEGNHYVRNEYLDLMLKRVCVVFGSAGSYI